MESIQQKQVQVASQKVTSIFKERIISLEGEKLAQVGPPPQLCWSSPPYLSAVGTVNCLVTKLASCVQSRNPFGPDSIFILQIDVTCGPLGVACRSFAEKDQCSSDHLVQQISKTFSQCRLCLLRERLILSTSFVDFLPPLRRLPFVPDGPVKSKAATENFIEESMTAASKMFADATQVQYTTVDYPRLIQHCPLKADG